MFSDIKGSTAYFEKYGDAAGLLMVHQCNDTIRRLVGKHGGRVVKTIGDGTMATFPEPRRAVKSAIEIQRALAELGAARAEPERIVAAPVVAAPGQIIVSQEIYEQVREGGFNYPRARPLYPQGKGRGTHPFSGVLGSG